MNLFEFFMILVLVFALVVSIFLLGAGIGYKTGQINAIKGEIHYHLEKQPNGETEWVKIK